VDLEDAVPAVGVEPLDEAVAAPEAGIAEVHVVAVKERL